jgi:hypothetical protein
MAGRVGLVERGLDWLLHHISGTVALILVLLLYPGLGLILPLALGLPTFFLVVCNIVGTVWAAVIALGWSDVLRVSMHRRHLVDWTTDLRRLNSTEFEWLVGEVFRREGWSVRETGRVGQPDGNIDLEVTRGGNRVIVQCKRWQSWQVGVDDVRGFLGTVTREGLPPQSGIFVTLSSFTDQARAEVAGTGLQLLDGRALQARIESVRKSEPCPRCSAPMTLGKSPYGWWFRCQAQGCGGKRDLGREPAVAVELLMSPN